jgi:hypothetical protein
MPSIETENLIRNLAGQAGTRRDRRGMALAGAILASLIVAGTLLVFWIGLRPGLGVVIEGPAYLFKLAVTLSLAGAGFILVRRAARPGAGHRALPALAPALALLLFGLLTDGSPDPLRGHSGVSAWVCVTSILAMAVPALALILAALRTGAPTRLGASGAAAGLFAGSLGAAVYTLACVNDGRMFVAVWYSVAILIATGLGALVGRRALAW